MHNDDFHTAFYYLKADEKACLIKEGVNWLLNYSGIEFSEKDIQRLNTLSSLNYNNNRERIEDVIEDENIIEEK